MRTSTMLVFGAVVAMADASLMQASYRGDRWAKDAEGVPERLKKAYPKLYAKFGDDLRGVVYTDD